ncbi:MAG: sugar transporter [Methyloprofundus sp.]|nr:sugar transporter [Methyloprofundus sp.]
MSRFKDAVAKDIKQVFINPLEFADQHDINGELVDCMIDSDILKERNAQTYAEFAEGVNLAQKVIYVALADLPQSPIRGELFFLDGKRFIVDDVAENDGMLEITIGANDT